MERGIATFTLDFGKCPSWLFIRMVKLGRKIVRVLIEDFGPEVFVKRIADPIWFQSLGTVLAFDWNASGLTTTLTAALKEAIRYQEAEFGVFICGGKGRTSLKTPVEIANWGERLNLPSATVNSLVYNSKMSAKVDSSLVQDGYQIYHHTFFFTKSGSWTVVQQGMNTKNLTARRYHWYSGKVTNLVCEPHTGIVSQSRSKRVLNLVDRASSNTQHMSLQLVLSGYQGLLKDIKVLRYYFSSLSKTISLKIGQSKFTFLKLADSEFYTHKVEFEDFFDSPYLIKILGKVCNEKPQSYERLLAIEGVGPKTIRALALISEIIYGASPSYLDPARYSFAHGGKDSTPFPIDLSTYDEVIEILSQSVSKAKISPIDKDKIQRRLFKNGK